MTEPIRPMNTYYKGYRFRSRLEARWAVFYDRIGIPWHYETKPIEVGGEPYLPDFFVTVGNSRICQEVKPDGLKEEIRPLRVYLAGKVHTVDDWRGEASVLSRHKRHGVIDADLDDDPVKTWLDHAQTKSFGNVSFTLTGPFPSSCDHGCAHAPAALHMAQTCYDVRRDRIVAACFAAINSSDIVCAHINTADAYGTLIEVAWALSRGKPVSLTLDWDLCCDLSRSKQSKLHWDDAIGSHDLWFIETMVEGAPGCSCIQVHDAEAARRHHGTFIAAKTHRNYRLISCIGQSGQHAALTFGDPYYVALDESAGHWFGAGARLRAICANNRDGAEYARAYRFDRGA